MGRTTTSPALTSPLKIGLPFSRKLVAASGGPAMLKRNSVARGWLCGATIPQGWVSVIGGSTHAEEADEPAEAVADDAGELGVVREDDAAVAPAATEALGRQEVEGEAAVEEGVAVVGVDLGVELGDELLEGLAARAGPRTRAGAGSRARARAGAAVARVELDGGRESGREEEEGGEEGRGEHVRE
jgi:hypothetical protein